MLRKARPIGLHGLLAACLFAACLRSPPSPEPTLPGKLVLVVLTDMVPGEAIETVSIRATEGNKPLLEEERPVGPGKGSFPLIFGLQGATQAGAPVQMTITGSRKGTPVVLADITSRVPDRETRSLRVTLSYLCTGSKSIAGVGAQGRLRNACQEGSTCVAGRCVGSELGTEPGMDPLAVAPTNEDEPRRCLPLGHCFGGAFERTPYWYGDQCVVDASGAKPEAPFAALHVPNEGWGFCDGVGNCLVPLGTAMGYAPRTGNLLGLPPGVCDIQGATVAVSAQCGQSPEGAPPCFVQDNPYPQRTVSPVDGTAKPVPSLVADASVFPTSTNDASGPAPFDGGAPSQVDTENVRTGGIVLALALAPGTGLHTCALVEGGYVRCWGPDTYGQLGSSSLTANVPGLQKAVGIALGENHTCARIEGGTLRCWGSNSRNQLGVPAPDSPGSATEDIPGLSGVLDAAAGAFHTCVLREGGRVRCWGNDAARQLAGSSVTEDVEGLSGVQSLTAAGDVVCVLLDAGTVRCWGDNSEGQSGWPDRSRNGSPRENLPGLSGVKAISASEKTVCALLRGGTVRCWGSDFFQVTGGGSLTKDVPGVTGAVHLSVGYASACVTRSQGNPMCWGTLGDSQTIGTLATLELPGLTDIVSFAPGTYSMCAVTGSHDAWCWGQPLRGTSNSVALPLRVPGLSPVSKLRIGGYQSCVLLDNGTLQCWGNKVWPGSSTDAPHVETAENLPPLRDVSIGSSHGCGVTTTGGVTCFGYDPYGELGTDITPTLHHVLQVAAGGSFSCALLQDTTVRCWGDSSKGATGGSSGGDGIAGLSGVLAITAGANHACTLQSDRTVRCWGSNGAGQTAGASPTEPVQGLSQVMAVQAGQTHTCALLEQGTVRCWGANDAGQVAASAPDKDLPGLSGVVELSSHHKHSCARLVNGTVRCWGSRESGETGGSSPSQSISGLSGVTHVETGASHSCALLDSGSVLCWGDNGFGQVTGILKDVRPLVLRP